MDNIDHHNPSSTVSKESFHGTGISLLQHPSFDGEGVDCNIALVGESHSSKSVDHLPHFYTDVTPVTESVKNLPIPATTITSLNRERCNQLTKQQYYWLDSTKEVLYGDKSMPATNVSWAAYHVSQLSNISQV